MTDVHCHIRGGDPCVRELVVGEHFSGIHPWDAEGVADIGSTLCDLRSRLESDPSLGVGEIGLDRLRTREISSIEEELFERQLALAVEFGRPVVLHGAKCWGRVMDCVRRRLAVSGDSGTRFLFHGFSRSAGLIPAIASLGAFISVGPAILNDHAVNYRELVVKIPDRCLLLETDRTAESAAGCPAIAEIAAKVAQLRGVASGEIERLTDANCVRFFDRLVP